ncbi:MAG: pseudouridine synthase [Woeseiaceae bacterium]
MLRHIVPLILLNKPNRVLCQFRDTERRSTLADFVVTPAVYPAGRLDYDSEGLLLLTDDGRLQAHISQPRSKLLKRYWVEVEGEANAEQLQKLGAGVSLKDGAAKAIEAHIVSAPAGLWSREPPIRRRKNIPTSWLDLAIAEGRNRQVRRMTAAVDLPTLRLIRHAIGPWSIDSLKPGETRMIENADAWRQLQR